MAYSCPGNIDHYAKLVSLITRVSALLITLPIMRRNEADQELDAVIIYTFITT